MGVPNFLGCQIYCDTGSPRPRHVGVSEARRKAGMGKATAYRCTCMALPTQKYFASLLYIPLFDDSDVARSESEEISSESGVKEAVSAWHRGSKVSHSY